MVDEPTEAARAGLGMAHSANAAATATPTRMLLQLQSVRDIRRADRADGNAGPAQALLNGNQGVGPGLSEPNLAQEHLSPSLSLKTAVQRVHGRAAPGSAGQLQESVRRSVPWSGCGNQYSVEPMARNPLDARPLGLSAKACRCRVMTMALTVSLKRGEQIKRAPDGALALKRMRPRRGDGTRRCGYRSRSGRRSRRTTAPGPPCRWRAWPASTPCPRYRLAPPARCR